MFRGSRAATEGICPSVHPCPASESPRLRSGYQRPVSQSQWPGFGSLRPEFGLWGQNWGLRVQNLSLSDQSLGPRDQDLSPWGKDLGLRGQNLGFGSQNLSLGDHNLCSKVHNFGFKFRFGLFFLGDNVVARGMWVGIRTDIGTNRFPIVLQHLQAWSPSKPLPFWPKFCLTAHIQAIWPKSKQIGPNLGAEYQWLIKDQGFSNIQIGWKCNFLRV